MIQIIEWQLQSKRARQEIQQNICSNFNPMELTAVIPKSTHEKRIKENSQVFNFHLEEKDMKLLDSLNEDLHTVFL